MRFHSDIQGRQFPDTNLHFKNSLVSTIYITAKLVVGSLTTSELLVLYVFGFSSFCLSRRLFLRFARVLFFPNTRLLYISASRRLRHNEFHHRTRNISSPTSRCSLVFDTFYYALTTLLLCSRSSSKTVPRAGWHMETVVLHPGPNCRQLSHVSQRMHRIDRSAQR